MLSNEILRINENNGPWITRIRTQNVCLLVAVQCELAFDEQANTIHVFGMQKKKKIK